MQHASEEFLLHADGEAEKVKALLDPRFEAAIRQTKALKALVEAFSSLDEEVHKLLSSRENHKNFSEEDKALLDPQADVLKALVKVSGTLEDFLQAASAMSLDIFGPKVRREYEVVLSLGCPEHLAKDKTLVDLLIDRLPDRAVEFGHLEMRILAKMVEECAKLATSEKVKEKITCY